MNLLALVVLFIFISVILRNRKISKYRNVIRLISEENEILENRIFSLMSEMAFIKKESLTIEEINDRAKELSVEYKNKLPYPNDFIAEYSRKGFEEGYRASFYVDKDDDSGIV